MAIIFITHDILVSLKDFADRILVMYKGERVEEGETARVLSNPKHQYTKALLAQSCGIQQTRPTISAKLRTITSKES